jgi:hypothetical protein
MIPENVNIQYCTFVLAFFIKDIEESTASLAGKIAETEMAMKRFYYDLLSKAMHFHVLCASLNCRDAGHALSIKNGESIK